MNLATIETENHVHIITTTDPEVIGNVTVSVPAIQIDAAHVRAMGEHPSKPKASALLAVLDDFDHLYVTRGFGSPDVPRANLSATDSSRIPL